MEGSRQTRAIELIQPPNVHKNQSWCRGPEQQISSPAAALVTSSHGGWGCKHCLLPGFTFPLLSLYGPV